MLEPRWTYSNPRGLTNWYGHVGYYGPYVIGQWFALDANTGAERWSRRFFRPNAVIGYAHEVIVASETRSDGPWTAGFGIYGIDASTGQLLWSNHAHAFWGKMLRCFDYIPGFTNEFRDAPKFLVDRYVVTGRGRTIDVRTGRECPPVKINEPPNDEISGPGLKLYDNKSLEIDGDTLKVERACDDFAILRRDRNGRDVWRFSAKDRSFHVDGNYYSYRFHRGRILIVLGDAPSRVPIDDAKPLFVKPNPANYQMGILDVVSGECKLVPLANARQRKECRIEAIRDSRILVSCDGTQLTEYEIAT
jgi:hypothetical protein